MHVFGLWHVYYVLWLVCSSSGVIGRPCSAFVELGLPGHFDSILFLINLLNTKFIIILTHISLASHKGDNGKQCSPSSDAAERVVWSGTTLFALISDISTKHDNNKN